jgi:hypothetical protein
MKVKESDILWNVKTHWINMFSPTKQVMSIYLPLVAKMAKTFNLSWLLGLILSFCVT